MYYDPGAMTADVYRRPTAHDKESHFYHETLRPNAAASAALNRAQLCRLSMPLAGCFIMVLLGVYFSMGVLRQSVEINEAEGVAVVSETYATARGGFPGRLVTSKGVGHDDGYASPNRPEADHRPCVERASDFLPERTIPGFYVVCFQATKEREGDLVTHRLQAFSHVDSLKKPQIEREYTIQLDMTKDSPALSRSFQTHMRISWVSVGPNFAIFTTDGVPADYKRLDTAPHILNTGGNWIWPGITQGHKQLVHIPGRSLTLETLSIRPLVFSVSNFLSPEERQLVIDTAAPLLEPSKVRSNGTGGAVHNNQRSSETAWLPSHWTSAQALSSVNIRVAELLRMDVTHQESTQVLKYKEGGFYGLHTDQFPQTDRQMANRKRHATLLWYMNDVLEGGETSFPYADKLQDVNIDGDDTPGSSDLLDTIPGNKQMKEVCSTGLQVKPQAGTVVLFYDVYPDGQEDLYSTHAACPVGPGSEKWAANKWIWTRPIWHQVDGSWVLHSYK